MKKFILFFLVLFSNTLLADAEPESDLPPLANIDCEPSLIVNRAVNVFSGAYCDSQVDLIIPGPRPLTLERSYSSNNDSPGTLFHSWNLNHTSYIKGSFRLGSILKSKVTIFSEFGSAYSFEGRIGRHVDKLYPHQVDISTLHMCTNTSSGEISGRTNIKNNTIRYRDCDKYCDCKTSAGDKIIFHKAKKDLWRPKRKIFLNGDKLNYKHNNFNVPTPKKIVYTNKNDEFISSLEWKYFRKDKFKKNPKIEVTASDGRLVTYHFQSLKNKRGDYQYYLNRVIRPNAPEENYIYEHKTNRIIRKERPDSRYLNIAYYEQGDNHFGGTHIKIESKTDDKINRVKYLEAPVGTDNSPIITHKFLYNSYTTEVFDALNHKTIYKSIASKLSEIAKYRDNGDLLSREHLYWGSSYYLLSRTLYTNDEKIIFYKNYEYDASGNVIKDSLYGNLSGWNFNTIELNNINKIKKSGGEQFVKSFLYNERNLMIGDQNNRRSIQYFYADSSDLLLSKLTSSTERIEKRSFYEYDGNGSIIFESHDNGSKREKEDLESVTARTIKRIIPTTTPVGFPCDIQETYLDLSTGSECLLKRTLNHFSTIGRLEQRDSYDSNNNYVFSEFWQYDSMGNQILALDGLGQATTRQFDANSNLIYEQCPRKDFHKEFVYDFSNRLIREEVILDTGLRLVTSHKYDLVGNRIATVDYYGNETRYEFDEFHRPIKTILPLVQDENGNLVSPEINTEYDIMSHPTKIVDPRGRVTQTNYNILGKPSFIVNPDGTEQKNIYDMDGTLKKSISTTGLTTCYEYDFQERVTLKERYSPEGTLLDSESFTYDAFNLLSHTDPEGQTTNYKYDGARRLIEKSNGSFLMRYDYDSLGRISQEYTYSDHDSFSVKSIVYDLLSRIVEETIEDSDGTPLRKIGYSYDENGNRTEVIHYVESGPSITKTKYDFQGKPVEIIDPCGNITTIFYDYHYKNEFGQTVPYEEIIDPYGSITATIFDALGRKAQTLRKNSLGDIIQDRRFYYDLSGNLAKQVDRIISPDHEDRSAVVTWKYDSGNREIECIEALGTPEQKITRTIYNSKGQKERVIKPDGVEILHTYDVFGRLESYRSSDDSFHYIYKYDSRGNPVCVFDEIHRTRTLQTFDNENRLIQETLGNGFSLSYRYDAQGRPIELKLPDHSSVEYTYNGLDLKTVRRVKRDKEYTFNYYDYDLRGNPLRSDQSKISYDLMGRIIDITSDQWESHNLTYDKIGNLIYRNVKDSAGNDNYYYTYDELQQLKTEEGALTHEYVYDSIYNRLRKDDKTFTYNALNQIVDPSYVYDANGCLIQRENEKFEYDALNRLTVVIQDSLKSVYRYDERNRRISKYLYTREGNLLKTVHYLYTGANEIGSMEGNTITELRILGIGKGAELGAAVAMEFDGKVYFPTHDHNGNVVALADEAGNLIEDYRYTAFGEETILNALGTWINPWRFSSKRVDEETGFVYFGRRYYDVEKGRWMTPDPAGFSEGPNLYAYVSNNPLTNVDLYGLMLEGNHSYICQAVQWLGAALRLIGDHMLPIPIVREVVSYTGQMLENRSISDYRPSSRLPHSKNNQSLGSEGPQEDQNIFINGICTSLEEVIARAQNISILFGGININYTFNATHGFISDIFETVAQKMGLPTRSVDKCVDEIRARIAAAGGVNSGNRVNIYAHSQGGTVLSCALDRLTAEEKKMLHIKTFGSATMISSVGLGSAVNYINSRDYVPYIGDLIGIVKSCFSDNYDIRRLPSDPTSYFDHGFDGGNYWDQVALDGARYVEKYGRVSK